MGASSSPKVRSDIRGDKEATEPVEYKFALVGDQKVSKIDNFIKILFFHNALFFASYTHHQNFVKKTVLKEHRKKKILKTIFSNQSSEDNILCMIM